MCQKRVKTGSSTKRNLTRLRLINSVIRETKQKTSCSNKSHACPMETGTKHKAHYGQRRDPPSLHGHVRYTKPLRDYGYHSADWIERISHARTRRAHSRPHWRAIEPAIHVYIYTYARMEYFRTRSRRGFLRKFSATLPMAHARLARTSIQSLFSLWSSRFFLIFVLFQTILWNFLLIDITYVARICMPTDESRSCSCSSWNSRFHGRFQWCSISFFYSYNEEFVVWK